MPDWMERPIHQAIYSVQRTAASVGWGIDRSGLYLVELLERFRGALVTDGFSPAIDTVSTSVLGISKPAFQLAFTLGMLLLIATPIISLKFFNIRNAIVIAALLPIALPVAGSIFQSLEQIRGDLGNELYRTIFDSSSFDLLPANEEYSGTSPNMGALTAYSPEQPCCRGLDVAAAYLWANRADVIDANNPPPADLPDEFENQFFNPTMDEFGELEGWQRWEQIRLSNEGITRTFYGIILVMFAFLESLTNLAFTLALGFLLIALLISLIFVWLAPFEHITYGLGKKVMELMVSSWGISVLQGLLVAAVIDVANGSNAFATLGIGILALVLQGIFVFIGGKAIFSAVMGAAAAATGGTVTERDVKSAAGAMMSTAAMIPGASTTLGGMKLAYDVARGEGAGRMYSAGFALSQFKPMARAGALATAMGSVPESFGQGLTARERTNDVRAVRYDQAGSKRSAAVTPTRVNGSSTGTTGTNGNGSRDGLYTKLPAQPGETMLPDNRAPVTPEAIAEAIVEEVQNPQNPYEPGLTVHQQVANRLGRQQGKQLHFRDRAVDAVNLLVQDLKQANLPPYQAKQLLQSAYTNGKLTPEQQSGLVDTFMSRGMNHADAQEQAKALVSRMTAMPGAVYELEPPPAPKTPAVQRLVDPDTGEVHDPSFNPRAVMLERMRDAGLPPGLSEKLATELTDRGKVSPELLSRASTAFQNQGMTEDEAQAAVQRLVFGRSQRWPTMEQAGVQAQTILMVVDELESDGRLSPEIEAQVITEMQTHGGYSADDAQARLRTVVSAYQSDAAPKVVSSAPASIAVDVDTTRTNGGAVSYVDPDPTQIVGPEIIETVRAQAAAAGIHYSADPQPDRLPANTASVPVDRPPSIDSDPTRIIPPEIVQAARESAQAQQTGYQMSPEEQRQYAQRLGKAQRIQQTNPRQARKLFAEAAEIKRGRGAKNSQAGETQD